VHAWVDRHYHPLYPHRNSVRIKRIGTIIIPERVYNAVVNMENKKTKNKIHKNAVHAGLDRRHHPLDFNRSCLRNNYYDYNYYNI